MATVYLMERVFLLDRSGSMQNIRLDTIGGYNAFVSSQTGGTMSLYLFDHELQEVYKNVPMNEVKALNVTDFVPRGSTALLDALGHVLKTFEGKPTVVILTDGEENSSTKFTHAHIKDLIEMRKGEGWDFVYLGEDIKEGQGLGITTSFKFEGENTGKLFATLSGAMTQASQTGEAVTF